MVNRKNRLIWTTLTGAALTMPLAGGQVTAAEPPLVGGHVTAALTMPLVGGHVMAAEPQVMHGASASSTGVVRDDRKNSLGGAAYRMRSAAEIRAVASSGEGGEGGEAGVDTTSAATDPAVFLTALDVIAAHYHAGRAAYLAGATEEAGEMFVHPISEVYADLEETLAGLGVTPFLERMEQASTLALEQAGDVQVNEAADAVLAALSEAEEHAPEASRSALAVQAAVIADMADRAAVMFHGAEGDPESGAYLDGFGFAMAARLRADAVMGGLDAEAPEAAETLQAMLDLLAVAYPSALRPEILKTDSGTLLGQSSRLAIALGKLR